MFWQGTMERQFLFQNAVWNRFVIEYVPNGKKTLSKNAKNGKNSAIWGQFGR